MRALKVLFLAHSYPRVPGDAAGSFLWHLAVALQEEQVHVSVVAPSAPGYSADDVFEGIPVHRFRYAPAGWETLAYTGNMAAEVQGSLRGRVAVGGLIAGGGMAVVRTARAFAPDLLHAHWWFPGGVSTMYAAWRLGIPMITTMHGSDVRLARGSRASHWMMRRVLGRSARTTTVSSWLASEVRAIAPQAAPLVEPMPVATELFQPVEGASRRRLLFVGRLNRQKGIADLIEALAQSPSHVELDVVGDGNDRQALVARAETIGVAHRIVWHGALRQPALVPLYQHALATVIPSIDEGLGLVAVEAALCESAVVAYASGGTPDIVHDGETGVLVAPGDVRALAAAISRLVEAPELARRLGSAGRTRALARFAPSSVARRYAAIYRDVARENVGRQDANRAAGVG